MRTRRRLVRWVSLCLSLGAAGLFFGCGVMFGDVEDECSGACSDLRSCPISACGCQNKVARIGISCSSAGGCCLAQGYVCDEMCEGHGGVAKIETLSCSSASDCSACGGPTCNCWDGNDVPAGCLGSFSGSTCCLTGVTDWTALCHGYCAAYGGLKGLTP